MYCGKELNMSYWGPSEEPHRIQRKVPTQGLESCHENGNPELDRLDITKIPYHLVKIQTLLCTSCGPLGQLFNFLSLSFLICTIEIIRVLAQGC